VPTLTIAIPSYNRNRILEANVQRLLPQLVEGVELLVLDNHSPVPVQLGCEHPRLRVLRNPHNIGGNGNILRCFESCASEWIWVLGDDDAPEEGAVATILQAIADAPQTVIFNFSTAGSFTRGTSVSGSGRGALLAALDDFGNLLFISSCVFRAPVLIGKIDHGFQYAYSCAPHLAMLFSAMDQDSPFVLSHRSLVRWERREVEDRGSLMVIAAGLPTLLELPFQPAERQRLAGLMARHPRMAAVAHELFLQCVFEGKPSSTARAQLRLIIQRIPFWSAPLRHLAGCIWGMLLWLPGPAYRLVVRPLYRMSTGHDSGAHKLKADRL
jgi:hypothetical protein